MMQPLPRRERVAVGLWVVLATVVGNSVYDLLLTRGIKDYLLRHALYEAGRGPDVPMRPLMDLAVSEAIWVSTLWACVILLAGMITIRLMRPYANRESPT